VVPKVVYRTPERAVEPVEEVGAVVVPEDHGEAVEAALTMIDLVEKGYVHERDAKDMVCVLGRNAVSPVQKCRGIECMGWRYAPKVPDEKREMGYCGMAGSL